MPAFVVGDVHGHRDVLVGLLRDAGLVDAAEQWIGADATLWLTGDLVDRGPDGIGAIELVMRLEREGDVHCLLGNHEVMLLAVDRHARAEVLPGEATFAEIWVVNGGRVSDLRSLTDEHRAWMSSRPLVGRAGDWLVLHADTDRYLELGATADALAAWSAETLHSGSASAVGLLLEVLCDRDRLSSTRALQQVLDTYGGDRVVHGHTPIALVTGASPETVTEPFVYAGGRVTNVDHCLFAGGPGFITRLE